MTIFNHQHHKGFTLIETLFAILIFSAALISLMVISSKGISATNQVKNETTAHYLAQEGLEVVRNIRDSNFVVNSGASPIDWMTGIVDGAIDCELNACNVVYNGISIPPTLAIVSGSSDQVALAADGTYGNTGTFTGFSRRISVTAVPNANGGVVEEYRVASEVSWQAKTIRRSITLQTVLKKWQ